MGHRQVCARLYVRVLKVELALLLRLCRVLRDLPWHHLPPVVRRDGPLLRMACLAIVARHTLFFVAFSLSIELLRVPLDVSDRH